MELLVSEGHEIPWQKNSHHIAAFSILGFKKCYYLWYWFSRLNRWKLGPTHNSKTGFSDFLWQVLFLLVINLSWFEVNSCRNKLSKIYPTIWCLSAYFSYLCESNLIRSYWKMPKNIAWHGFCYAHIECSSLADKIVSFSLKYQRP